MKKVLVALVAVFAFGTMAIAQETVEMNLDNNAFATVSEADYSSAVADLEDFDLSDLKDFSFATENEDFSTLVLDKAQGDNRIIGAILAIFLGDFGIHHFYSGDTSHGIWHLVFFWTGIPGLIGFIEGIIWLVDEGSYPQALIDML